MERLRFESVSRSFKSVKRGGEPIRALNSIDLSVRDGEIVSIVGPSGCGKSTILNLASGLDRPSGGSVFVDEEPVEGANPHVAFMLQRDVLLAWRTIVQNVELGLEIRGVSRKERRERAFAQLDQLGLHEFADAYPHQLSGGMRQRAALARTLVNEPSILLLDEPFSAVDAITKMSLHQDLATSLRRAAKTAVLITHDIEESVTLSNRILVMSPRPGRIIREIAVGLPDPDRPLARRRHPDLPDYVAELMNALGIAPDGDPTREAQIA
jgi:NitT/TauT family transport system ATP-binding protein